MPGLFLRPGLLIAILAMAAGAGGATAQETARSPQDERPAGSSGASTAALQRRLEEQFRLVPLQEGVLLVPRRPGRSFKGIELRQGGIAVDGVPVSGVELRTRLGADADAVLSASYLDGDTLAAMAAPVDRRVTAAAQPLPPAPDSEVPPGRTFSHHRHARVRIGSDLVIGEDEQVDDAAVAILGSVTVNGLVKGEVVAVGGNVKLGPKAIVRGDVVSVGGTLETDPAARIYGGVSEVGIRFPDIHLPNVSVYFPGFAGYSVHPWVGDRWWAAVALVWTAFRFTIVGVAALLMTLLAGGVVGRARDQLRQAPVQTGLVGLLAHVLIPPAFLALVLVLLVSIVGIPLVALVPVLAAALGIVWVAGFAAVAQVVGGWVPGLRDRPVASLLLGLAAIWVCSLGARGLWWWSAGWFSPAALWGVGLLIEFVAWTFAIGAVLLAWVQRRRPVLPAVVPVTPPAPAEL